MSEFGASVIPAQERRTRKRAGTFTDAELDAELALIREELLRRGRPLIDKTWKDNIQMARTDREPAEPRPAAGSLRGVCRFCGEEFAKSRAGTVYCSRACRNHSGSPRVRREPALPAA
jgi:hypothetical protein